MNVVIFRASLAAALTLALSSVASATDVPQNLGYGLDKLVESRVQLKAGHQPEHLYDGYTTEAAAYYASQAITDAESGRVLVDVTLNGRESLDDVRARIELSVGSFEVTAVDRTYRSTGIIEGFVSVDDAAALSQIKGVRAVFLGLKPDVNRAAQPTQLGPVANVVPGDHLKKLGSAFDQGVYFERVDQINQFYNASAPVNYDGNGVSVGLMSDSYNVRNDGPTAPQGVTSFDLPGSASHPLNTQPVVLLQDLTSGTDEGRGMVEIVHKMAPKARLAFATAALGEVEMGNNIRALAGVPGFTYPAGVQQGFKADVIADDISYGGEPFYGETIVGNAIDEVAALGVAYFSSAGNNIGINAYESPLRMVANGTGLTSATNSALAGTNINLASVPTNLYAGGFHNFNPNAGQLDVAQLVNMPTAAQTTEMQWDDPYDQHDLVLNNPPVFSGGGTMVGTTPVVFSSPALPVFTKGQPYVIQETAINGATLDGIVTIRDAANNVLISQDTGIDETVTFFPPATGNYTITVTPFSGTGDFSLVINSAQGSVGVTTDLNLLVFRADTGAFIASRSLTANNLANNRPVELGSVASPSGQTQVQFVIARAFVPTAAQLPTRVRWSVRGNGAAGIGPAEYFTYNAVTTKGHATARGCNGTAAYSVFRPNMAESFTSPGPATILFDKDANRLTTPEIRQQPRVAAADAANTSSFQWNTTTHTASDSTADSDASPNFSGTSAAAPHAAAIAALLIQARGGPGSIAAPQITSVLQSNAFPHDLDPGSSSGTALTSDGAAVMITIDSDNDSNKLTGAFDVNSFKVSFVGPGSLQSLVFNPNGLPAEGGNVTGGNSGFNDDVGSNPATVAYFEGNFPGLIWVPNNASTGPFALGTLTGLVAADITQPQSTSPFTGFTNPAPAPGSAGMFETMTIGFPTAQFTDGKILRFTVGRGLGHNATLAAPAVGIQANADLFGGGVLIPSGTIITDGMRFSGTTTGGGTFSGTIKNNIGTGYSPVDGYGLINAQNVVAPQAVIPVGFGKAAPTAVSTTDTVLLTVKVIPGATPTSTTLVVRGDLSSIGGTPNQLFYDDGTHGDATANDKTYSYQMVVPLNVTSGGKTLAATISDAQGRSGSAVIPLAIKASTAPTVAGSASPSSGPVNSTTLLTATVTGGSNPASTNVIVAGDLSSIGGSATAAFHDDGLNGDVTAGDGIWSFNATVAPATTVGAKSFPISVSDLQGRAGSTLISFTVVAPTSPTGVGAANPSTLSVTETTLLTVQTTSGTNPASTGLSVNADLTSIGGSAAQAFHDDGLNGDVTAADGTFSYLATVQVGTTPGGKSLSATISDGQLRSSTTSIALSILTPLSPSGTGSAMPNSAALGVNTLLTVAVTGGSNPASSGIAVTADLSSIGGSATQAFHDDGLNGDAAAGDGTWSYSATVGGSTTPGLKSLPVTITDAQSRSGSASISLSVPNPVGPNGTGLATPATVNEGDNAVLIVAVVPGNTPTSTGLAVVVDLSSIGGSATQTFYDDGSHGDQTAGDNVFTFTATVPVSVLPGSKALPVTISDAQSRTGNAMINIAVTDVIFANDFE